MAGQRMSLNDKFHDFSLMIRYYGDEITLAVSQEWEGEMQEFWWEYVKARDHLRPKCRL
jgi:hypothetical protein